MIVRAFFRMRELIAHNKDIAARVEKLERGHERTASVIEVRGGHRPPCPRSEGNEGDPARDQAEDWVSPG